MGISTLGEWECDTREGSLRVRDKTRDPGPARPWPLLESLRLSATGSVQLPCTQPPANCFCVLLVAASREGRQPSAGVFRLSLWDIKEGFSGCSRQFHNGGGFGSRASRQLSRLVIGRKLGFRNPEKWGEFKSNSGFSAPSSEVLPLHLPAFQVCSSRPRQVCAIGCRRPRVSTEGVWLDVTGVREQDREVSASRLALTSSPEL